VTLFDADAKGGAKAGGAADATFCGNGVNDRRTGIKARGLRGGSGRRGGSGCAGGGSRRV
jgi:hypothetical protein